MNTICCNAKFDFDPLNSSRKGIQQANNIIKKFFIITLNVLAVLYCRNGIVKSDFLNSVYKSHGRGQNMTRRPLLWKLIFTCLKWNSGEIDIFYVIFFSLVLYWNIALTLPHCCECVGETHLENWNSLERSHDNDLVFSRIDEFFIVTIG